MAHLQWWPPIWCSCPRGPWPTCNGDPRYGVAVLEVHVMMTSDMVKLLLRTMTHLWWWPPICCRGPRGPWPTCNGDLLDGVVLIEGPPHTPMTHPHDPPHPHPQWCSCYRGPWPIPVKVTLGVSGSPIECQWGSRKYPGGRLNKKDGLTRYGDSHVKDKTS